MYSVVIVDDEQTVVRSLTLAAEWDEYELEIVLATTDVHEAAAYLTQHKVNLLITDVCMPEMDGLELIKLAKKHQPVIRSIVVSAHDRFDFVKQALELGAENYLLKPVDKTELNETLTKTLENIANEELGNILDISNRMAFRSNILDRWVRNSIDEEELIERAQFLNIDIDASGWAVLVIQPRNSEYSFSHSLQIINYLQKIQRDNLVTTSFTPQMFINGSFQIIGILHDYQHNQQQREEVDNYISLLRNFAGPTDIKIFASVGPSMPGFLDVSRSYNQALRFIRAAWFLDSPVYCQDYDIPGLDKDKKQIIQWIEQGRIQELKSWLRMQYQELIQKNQNQAQSHAVNWAVVMLESLNDLTCENIPTQLADTLTGFASSRIIQLEEWLCELGRFLIEWKQEQQTLVHPYVRKMIRIINDNYVSDLSLKAMADRFKVSAAYLGQLFRSHTGQYFNEYLTNIRLEKALELIEHTQRSISDISSSTGFSSQNYFNRLFKRTYGTTPGEYRMDRLP